MTGVQSSVMRVSAKVLRITSQPMPLGSPCVMPILSFCSDIVKIISNDKDR